MGEGHPERADRLRGIERALEAETFDMLARELRREPTLQRRAATPLRAHGGRRGHLDVARFIRGRLPLGKGAQYSQSQMMTQKVTNGFLATRPLPAIMPKSRRRWTFVSSVTPNRGMMVSVNVCNWAR